jgi:hypothetical protein
MFFIYKTNYSFNSAVFDTNIQSIHSFFIHNNNKYENKICLFGKVMAIIAIILAWIRINIGKSTTVLYTTVIFDAVCVILAYLMNLNAFVYIIPLIISELFIIYLLYI